MHATGAKKLGWGQRGFDRQKMREPSVKIESTWPVLDEIEFSRISRLQFDPEAPELLATAGTLRFYNRALDRLSTKTPRAVSIEDVALAPYARISDDPIVRRLAADGTAQVFMSDVVATLLMAAPRTVMPWDLVARRLDGTDALIIDQRDDAHLDYTPVGETSYEPPSDDKDQFNSAANLSTEATRISAILPTIICAPEETVSLEQEDMPARPPTGPRAGHTAYKYYKWTMGDGLHFVIRSEINGMARVASQQKTLLIRSLLEFDSSRSGSNVDWRTKLDNQRGAVLANEIKNNNAIIARWVFQALLAQADLIKLAYVARVSPKDRVRHDLLALHDLEPAELAVQINLDEANGFGILKTLVDRILSASVATVAIVRDPSKVPSATSATVSHFPCSPCFVSTTPPRPSSPPCRPASPSSLPINASPVFVSTSPYVSSEPLEFCPVQESRRPMPQ